MPRRPDLDTPPGTRRKPAILGDHEVGYGRPPKQHQFKPGEQNNPKGRKKKRPPSAGVNLTDVLMEPVTVVEKSGRKRKKPFAEALLNVTMQKALSGDARARAAIFELVKDYGLFNITPSVQRRIIIELVDPKAERRRIYGDTPRDSSDPPSGTNG